MTSRRVERGVTVVEVLRSMGYEPTKEITWAIGNAVRERWKERNDGALPPKELRGKTNGGGSHCFAVYPEEFRPVIEEIARATDVAAARQASLKI